MHVSYQNIIKFLDFLKKDGFVVGIDTHLQVWTILSSLPENTELRVIADFLCPIFSQSKEGQVRFYESFQRYSYILEPEVGGFPEPKVPEDIYQKPPSRIKYFVGGLLVTTLVIVLFLIINSFLEPEIYGCMDKSSSCYNPEATVNDNDACVECDSLVISVCMDSLYVEYVDTSRRDTKGTIYIACDSCCITKSNAKQATIDKVIQKEQKDSTTYIVPFDSRKLEMPYLYYNSISNTFKYWIYVNRLTLAIVFSILFLGLFISKIIYDRKQDEYNAERLTEEEPPYILPISITNKKEIGFDNKIKSFYSQLRGRELLAKHRIDILKTIDRTIKKGGFIDLQYRQYSRPSEYLILIDRNSEHNHQAQLFEHLYCLIRKEEILVHRYFYDHDIRYCWNEKHPKGIKLERLTDLHSEARLIIFSNGYSFINSWNNELQEWLAPLKYWSNRVLVTPTAVAGWNYREGILSQLFIVLPSNIQGLLKIVDHFEEDVENNLKDWKYNIGKADKPLSIRKDNIIEDLKQHLSKDMIRWIMSCAIYPDLHWDLTILIGHTLSTENNKLVTHENLIKLTRLSWFREGYMSSSVREELLSKLSSEDNQLVRGVIVQALEENIPTNKNSVAFKKHQLQLTINKLLLNNVDEDRKSLLIKAEALQHQGGALDSVSIKALKDKENQFLGFKLPKRLTSYFFRDGVVGFGMNNWVALTLLIIGLLGIWLTFFKVKSSYSNIVSLGEESYNLVSPEDTVDFYILQEIWNWEQVANRSDLRSEVTLDWETALRDMMFFEDTLVNLQYQDKLLPILVAQYNAYIQLYDSKLYENIIEAHRVYTPNPIFNNELYYKVKNQDSIPVYNVAVQMLQLDILQIVGLSEFYSDRDVVVTAFIDYLQSGKVTDSTRTAYLQSNVPNLYHLLEYDYVDSMVMNKVRVAKNGKYGFLDTLGLPTWRGRKLPYDYVSRYNENNQAIRLVDAVQCVIDESEKVIDCFDKLFPYKSSNGKWGYVNENNTLVIDAIYDEARPFGTNHAVVKKGIHYGMIDKLGFKVLDFEYTEFGEFVTKRRIALVRKGNQYGYISEDLSIKLATIYSRGTDFDKKNYTAAVTLNGSAIRINIKGVCINGCKNKFVIKGRVTNNENVALVNASVSTNYGEVKTDNRGYYSINFNINEKIPFSVNLSINGGVKYRTRTEVVSFSNDFEISHDVELEPVSVPKQRISGSITETTTNRPIANASINFFDKKNNKNYITVSDERGKYKIDVDIDVEKFSMSVSKEGFATDRKDVEVANNNTFKVVLRPEEISIISQNIALKEVRIRSSKKYDVEPIGESRYENRDYFRTTGLVKLGVVQIKGDAVVVRITDSRSNFDNSTGLEMIMSSDDHRYIKYKNKIYLIKLEEINEYKFRMNTVEFEVIEWSETFPIPQVVFVKGNSFSMGSENGAKDERRPHLVNVNNFNIGRFEVTNNEFIAFLNDEQRTVSNNEIWIDLYNNKQIIRSYNKYEVVNGFEDYPVAYVSWFGAEAYCKWLSRKTGYNYRLPTEAEWEFAAKGGKSNEDRFSGSDNIDEVAWYDNNTYKVQRVATKKANELGIYDMSGNVFEWCEDKWHDNYQGAPNDGSAWTIGSDNARVLRGGSWSESAFKNRVTYREKYSVEVTEGHIGFRVVKE